MFIRCFIICAVVQSAVFGVIQNGRFEVADPNSPPYLVAPLHWTRVPHPQSNYLDDCYASLHTDFDSPNSGWRISHPQEGQYFVLLSTGGFDNVDDRNVKGAAISQEVFLSGGDIIMGSYFFGTTDYRPFFDFGRITLERTDDPNNWFVIPGTYCDVADVDSYQSTHYISPETNGWISFTYAIEPNQAGSYFIKCEVIDFSDTIYPSFYAVDNLRVCYGVPLYGDLNSDCAVDLGDFTILSNLWLADCTDPNTYDPNFVCARADINLDNVVDPNDLILMSEYWLTNYKAD